jgi:hypothetical protein
MTKNNVKEGRLVLAHGFRQSVHGWLTHALGQNIMVRGTVLEELLTPWWTGQRERDLFQSGLTRIQTFRG